MINLIKTSFFYVLNIAFLLVFINIQAQQPTYIQYGLNDGLPSLQINNLFQDSNGFIWLASPMGASKFDGNSFETFDSKNGLSDQSVLDFKEDEKGKIWLISGTGSPCYIERGKVVLSETNEYKMTSYSGGDIVLDYLRSKDSIPLNSIPNQSNYFSAAQSARFDENSLDRWIGTWGQGVFYCQNCGTEDMRVRQYLKGKTITAILKDKESNFWFATLDEGVFMLAQPAVQTYTESNSKLQNSEIHSLKRAGDGRIWIGTSKGTVSILKKGLDQSLELNSSPTSYNRVHDIYFDKKGDQWVAMDEGLKLRKGQNAPILVYLKAAKKIVPSTNNKLWIALYDNPIELDPYLGSASKVIPISNTTSICADSLNRLYIGSKQGLYHHYNDTTFYWGKEEEWLSYPIADIEIDKKGRLWIATDGYGLIIKIDNSLIALSEQNGLVNNNCRSLFIDEKDNAWLGGNNGLQYIELNERSPDNSKIKTYTYLDGLPSNQVNDIYALGDTVWVGTIKGLAVFQPSQLKKGSVPPPIYFQSIKVWNQDTTLLKSYELPHFQNNIQLNYTGLSFRSDGNLSFKYRMENIDTSWQRTNQRSVLYPALNPGKYTFMVKAIDKDGNESLEPASIEIHILLPFWKRPWFLALAGFGLFFLLVFSGFGLFSYFKNRNELERRLVESQQTALRAQMNPHFIFNALNSIQYFITENDKHAANNYLSVFSTLMRKVLANSKKTSISLEDELEYLRLYLEIESLRFKDKFNYQINLDPTIEVDEVHIPPMLIQPYLENALQHGLLRKEGSDRNLELHLDLVDDFLLKCTVIDNGIGRRKAEELSKNRSSHTKGIGTTNPKERLEILNKLNEAQIKVQISDQYFENGESNGTQVELLIPVFYE